MAQARIEHRASSIRRSGSQLLCSTKKSGRSTCVPAPPRSQILDAQCLPLRVNSFCCENACYPTNPKYLLPVSCPGNSMAFVAIKIGRRSGQGRTRREGIWIDTQLTSNATVGLFSSQPFGPRPVGCFSALLTPYISLQICSSLMPVRLGPP